VSVREEDGTPVVGAESYLKSDRDALVCGSAQTDREGRADFERVPPDPARIFVYVKSSPPFDERQVGVLDLSRGDGRLDVRLPRPREIVLRVSCEGRRSLPPNWRVLVDQAWQEAAVGD